MHEPLLLVQSTPPDPYWDNVLFLSHFDGGANGSSFVDQKQHVISAYSGARIFLDGTPRFGRGSLSPNGGYIDINGADLELPGDFTMEVWMWANSLPYNANVAIIGHSAYATAGNGNFLLRTSFANSEIHWASYNGAHTSSNANETILPAVVPGGIPLRQWNHIAVTRQNSTVRIFLNGKLLGSVQDTKILNPSSAYKFRIGGGLAYCQSLDGNMDDFRITKDIARYTSDFEIPARAFPNRGI
jgi:hypothetical protein